MVRLSVPKPANWLLMDWLKPWISDTTVTTAITPMMMPSVVRKLRSLCARIAYSAERAASAKAYMALLVAQRVDGIERGGLGGGGDAEDDAHAHGETHGKGHGPEGHIVSLEGGHQFHHHEADAVAQRQADEPA